MLEIIYLLEVIGSSKNEIGISYGLPFSTLFTIFGHLLFVSEMFTELRE
jgi:hypothetical protein